MKIYFAFGLLLLMATKTSGFGLVSSMMSNPSTVLNAARYMTQILMRNMAQKRTSNKACVDLVSRSAVTFFNEAAASLQLGSLLQMTMRRVAVPTSDQVAVPLDKFCRMVRVRRLQAASDMFVLRLKCLGDGAMDDTDRLFRSLVHTIEHVCHDGGAAAIQFMADARQCRRLDAGHEEQIERVHGLRRPRRGVSFPTTTGDRPRTVTVTSLQSRNADTTTTPPPTTYPSLQACFDDVNELLPPGAQLSPREELVDVLLTLPALLPRLLRRDGLPQFCPALLKAGDCAHLALIECPQSVQKTMARFFQSTLRGILCENIPADEVLAQLIWSDQVKERYFGL